MNQIIIIKFYVSGAVIQVVLDGLCRPLQNRLDSRPEWGYDVCPMGSGGIVTQSTVGSKGDAESRGNSGGSLARAPLLAVCGGGWFLLALDWHPSPNLFHPSVELGCAETGTAEITRLKFLQNGLF